jgi:hypothetical protein
VAGGLVAGFLGLYAGDLPAALVGVAAVAGGLITGRLTRRARTMSD